MPITPKRPQDVSQLLEGYRRRRAELGNSGYTLAEGAKGSGAEARAGAQLLATAALCHAPELIDGEDIYDAGPVAQDVRARLALGAARDPAVELYLATFGWGWAHAAFERQGCNVYELGNGLADRLAHTELHGLTLDDVRLPFRAQYVTIPPGAGLLLPDGRPVIGAYLIECLSNQPREPGARVLAAHVHGAMDLEARFREAMLSGLAIRLEMRPGQDLATSAGTGWAVDASPDWQKPAVARSVAEAWRWLLNVLVYLTMPGARIEHRELNRDRVALQDRIAKLPTGEKRDRLKLRLKGEPSDHRIYLGAGIKYEGRDPSIPGGRTQPEYVVRVPGHWKMQAHGPGGALRKRIHVEPYWRNLDAALAPASVTRVTAQSSQPTDATQVAPALTR